MSTSEDPVLAAEANWKASGWEVGPHFAASLSLSRVGELLQASTLETLEPWDLTPARHEALAVLYFSRREDLPLRRLGAALMLHPASLTSTVDALERLGYAERVSDPTDRRAVNVRITDDGRRTIERAAEALLATRFGLAMLSADEATDLFQLLAKVRLDPPGEVGDDRQGRDKRPGWDSASGC